ncbi:helix-turn-helix domain-containing protein [Dongia deserti]|uniref:helix-turn-helix domain-containing protein n=1 Tax=Dongia deserti TaxID=2268030 RepID=UPI0013C4C7B7|nr:helix-turn-helix domain-containing protein [Dongia deserti]
MSTPSGIICGRIASIVAAVFGVPLADMLSENREREFARPRMVAIYVAQRTTGLPKKTIAKAFQRAPTSAYHSNKMVVQDMARDPEFSAKVLRCESLVRSEQAIKASASAVPIDIGPLASRAFELDPVEAAKVVHHALASFLRKKGEAA